MMLYIRSALAMLRTFLLTTPEEDMGFYFNPAAFVENLGYMGLGMGAILIVILVIVGITYLLNFLFKEKK